MGSPEKYRKPKTDSAWAWLLLTPLACMALLAAVMMKYVLPEYIPYCDYGVENPDIDHCAVIEVSDKKSCRLCPLNATCSNGFIRTCQPGFVEVYRHACIRDDNPAAVTVLLGFLEMDEAIRMGKTFADFGAADANVLTGQDIINELKLKGEFSPKEYKESSGTRANDKLEDDMDLENGAGMAIVEIANSISKNGGDKFCLRNRFSLDMENSKAFDEWNKIRFTSMKLGSPQDK